MTVGTSFKAAILATALFMPALAAASPQQAGATAPPQAATTPQDATDSGQLEEVVITARKRTENLQEVPLTITAFSSEAIERQGIKSVQDVVKFTPGLSYDKGFSPQDTRISIRGLPVVRGKPPVGVLLDGIDISSEAISSAGGSQLVNVKLVDVESIAVVKGPSSALYGRSAFGGAVVYTSKRPNMTEIEGSAQVDVATHNFGELRAALNIPVLRDKIAVRVNGVYSDFDGFYRNTVSGNTIGGDKLVGGAVAVRFKPVDGVDFTLRTSYSDNKSEARPSYYYGFANGRLTNRPLPANAVGLRLGTPPGGTPLPASFPFATIGTITAKGNQINLSVDPLTGKDFAGSRLRPWVSSLVGDIDLGFATLSSWTGYLSAKSSGRTDADFYGVAPTAVTLPTPGIAEALPAMFITDINVKAHQFSQDLRLGDDVGRLKWAIGGLYWMERYSSDNANLSVQANSAKPAGTSVARAHQMLGPAPRSHSERNTDHLSVYGSLTFAVTERLEASAEARYAREDVDSVFGPALSMLFNAAGQPYYAFGATPLNPRPSYSTTMFTPRGVVRYRFGEENNVYASYSEGQKPGGYLNVGAVTDTRLARYDPEKLKSYEAGVKTTWLDNRLRLNGSYFHMINTDRLNTILTPDPTSPFGTSSSAVNIGEVKIDGVELEMIASPGYGIRGAFAYSYVNARYTSSDSAQTSAAGIAAPGNCTVATVGPQLTCITNTNGNQLDFNAKHSLVGSLYYNADLGGDWSFDGGVDFQMKSKRYIDQNNLFALPSFWNFDLKAGVEHGSYSLLFYVNNVFDNRQVKSAQTGPEVYALNPPRTIYTAYAADKRQFGLRAGVKF